MALIGSPSPLHSLRPTAFLCGVLLFFAGGIALAAGEKEPNSLGCSNAYQLVKVKNWFNGVESPEIVGISAKFGATLPRHLSEAVKGPAVLTNPVTSCGKLSLKLSNSIALAIRGDCDFTDKAKVAESAGALGLMVINDDEELPEMACAGNESAISITIPVIMIPKSAGDNIRKSLTNDGRRSQDEEDDWWGI